MKIYNKLVRDKIPEIIESDGKRYQTYIADNKEYKSRLLDKLSEEVNEFREEPSLEELADILEVLDAIKLVYRYEDDEIQLVKQDKKDKRGSFLEKIILEYVE